MKMGFLCRSVLCLLCILASDFKILHAQKLEKLVIGYPAPVASLGIIEVMRKAGLFRRTVSTSISFTFKAARC